MQSNLLDITTSVDEEPERKGIKVKTPLHLTQRRCSPRHQSNREKKYGPEVRFRAQGRNSQCDFVGAILLPISTSPSRNLHRQKRQQLSTGGRCLSSTPLLQWRWLLLDHVVFLSPCMANPAQSCSAEAPAHALECIMDIGLLSGACRSPRRVDTRLGAQGDALPVPVPISEYHLQHQR